MGMPVISPGTGTEEGAVTDVITSVALLESALSHILNAEGEKMERIMEMENVTETELLCMNRSSEFMIDVITRLEMILQAKLETVLLQSPCTQNTGTGRRGAK
ncbi:MAG: hypothetical protein ACOYBE_06310 [Blautia sp.]